MINEYPTNDSATPVFRDDGELVGLLIPDGEQVAPCTVFGFQIGHSRPSADAAEFLLTEGLGILAEPWEMYENGQWLNVRILEANPTSVTVTFADYGQPELFGTRRKLDVPVGDILRKA